MGSVHKICEARAFLESARFEAIFSKLGYALAGLEDRDIEAIVDLVETLANQCRQVSIDDRGSHAAKPTGK